MVFWYSFEASEDCVITQVLRPFEYFMVNLQTALRVTLVMDVQRARPAGRMARNLLLGPSQKQEYRFQGRRV
ncbi:hypothetical protein KCU64_g63, partial [Aureobasidium melanogenum]